MKKQTFTNIECMATHEILRNIISKQKFDLLHRKKAGEK